MRDWEIGLTLIIKVVLAAEYKCYATLYVFSIYFPIIYLITKNYLPTKKSENPINALK